MALEHQTTQRHPEPQVAEVEAFRRVVEEVRADLEEECYEMQARLIAEDQLVGALSGDLLVWSDCIPPGLDG